MKFTLICSAVVAFVGAYDTGLETQVEMKPKKVRNGEYVCKGEGCQAPNLYSSDAFSKHLNKKYVRCLKCYKKRVEEGAQLRARKNNLLDTLHDHNLLHRLNLADTDRSCDQAFMGEWNYGEQDSFQDWKIATEFFAGELQQSEDSVPATFKDEKYSLDVDGPHTAGLLTLPCYPTMWKCDTSQCHQPPIFCCVSCGSQKCSGHSNQKKEHYIWGLRVKSEDNYSTRGLSYCCSQKCRKDYWIFIQNLSAVYGINVVKGLSFFTAEKHISWEYCGERGPSKG